MKNAILLAILVFLTGAAAAQRVLDVGPGKPYSNPQAAAAAAHPGDTIRMHPDLYPGNYYISNLKGRPDAWITLEGTDPAQVILEGSSEGLHLTDATYVHIRRLTLRGQKGNGMNIDDGGSFDSPTHHVIIEACTFRDMAASGNNDLLKLSGLDSFVIRNCHFENGSTGGSGIDMVGCHFGEIAHNRFVKLGSNSIQAKGGTSDLKIFANHFTNGGQRTLNLGGSTGAAFFRPAGANYEARDILVFANVIEGSLAPIAYVGCRNVAVVNNTLILPGRWIMRILQESTDTSYYLSCANNLFFNNVVVVDRALSTDVNIGPYTSPSTFHFSNNLWYHLDLAGWGGPQLPVPESNGIVQKDPLFVEFAAGNYRLKHGSPAIGKGSPVFPGLRDFLGTSYLPIPSIGAFEAGTTVSTGLSTELQCTIYPNPYRDKICIAGIPPDCHYLLVHARGSILNSGSLKPGDDCIPPATSAPCWLILRSGNAIKIELILEMK